MVRRNLCMFFTAWKQSQTPETVWSVQTDDSGSQRSHRAASHHPERARVRPGFSQHPRGQRRPADTERCGQEHTLTSHQYVIQVQSSENLTWQMLASLYAVGDVFWRAVSSVRRSGQQQSAQSGSAASPTGLWRELASGDLQTNTATLTFHYIYVLCFINALENMTLMLNEGSLCTCRWLDLIPHAAAVRVCRRAAGRRRCSS